MKKIILTFGVFAFIFASCGGGNTKLSLRGYNEKVVSIFNAASEKMASEREIVYEHKLTKEENLKLIEGLNKALDSCMTETDKLNYPEDAKNFHESIMGLYRFEKDSIMPLLTKTLEFEPESEEWYKVWREFDKKNEKVDVMLNEMEKHQNELAKKANSQLQ